MNKQLSVPHVGDEVSWVREHLSDLVTGDVQPSRAIRGGQKAADVALNAFDVTDYAADRNEVYPIARRGASMLSPYIRHGLISLPRAWRSVKNGPAKDVSKFRDELLWQEYARHLYARTGGTASSIRYAVNERRVPPDPDWIDGMACLNFVTGELEQDGWLVNQTRMWFASHWSVRNGHGWRDGEDYFFRHLLDGSRAANRLGWQWTVGAGTGKAYGFARAQVERRAPGLCGGCAMREVCPIQSYPDDPELLRVPAPVGVIGDPDPAKTAGPEELVPDDSIKRVWITAESLGDGDPAILAHADVPVVFIFDEALLGKLKLSGKRLVFLAESLADLATRREMQLWRGDPVDVLSGGGIATTYAPVPGWRRRANLIKPSHIHPWPWLVKPHGGAAGSFSAWRKGAGLDKWR